jgi:hypothetical protein
MPPCPKPEPRFKAKLRAKAEEVKQLKTCYAEVDQRDGHQCRICRARVGGLSMTTKRIHHHIVFRSRGGAHVPSNVASICPGCDDLIHREGRLQVSGDANERNSQGQLCGLKVERLTDAGWRVEGWR